MSKKENVSKVLHEVYDPRQMMNIANSYLKVVKTCDSDPTVESCRWLHPMLSSIVTNANAAFACEIFLKAILQKYNMPESGHDLLKLFQALPDEIKSIILGSKGIEVFIKDLTLISCLFEKWRYIYERGVNSLNYRFLINFAEKLSKITGEIV